MPPYFRLTWFIFYLLYCGYLLVCWAAWTKSKSKVLQNWRSAVLLVGLPCATLVRNDAPADLGAAGPNGLTRGPGAKAVGGTRYSTGQQCRRNASEVAIRVGYAN